MSTIRVSVRGASLVCSVDKHKVTGLCGLDRDLGRFEVTNLTDHDDVRILTQERLERRCEGQADFRIDVDLVDARQG